MSAQDALAEASWNAAQKTTRNAANTATLIAVNATRRRASAGSRLSICASLGGLHRRVKARLEPQNLLQRVLPGLVRRQHLPQLRLRHQLLERPGSRHGVPAVRSGHDERRNPD